jgi:hypothetical protein
MARAHMRPRVEIIVHLTPEEALARVRAGLARPDAGVVRGQMGGSHLALNIVDAERHFWSPWLDAHVEPHGEGAQIRGRLMPHPSIWTFYMLAYAVLITGGLIAGAYGVMQVVIGTGSWGLWIPPIAVLLGFALYVSAFVGQRLGLEQTAVLRAFLERALKTPAGPHPEVRARHRAQRAR